MRDSVREVAKKFADRLGYDVHRRDLAHPARRIAAMRHRGIDLVIDVGANTGQYVGWLRASGYDASVVSFEPIPAEFARLSARHDRDPHWTGRRCAVGAAAGVAELNISDSSLLSSILPARHELESRIPAAHVRERLEVPLVSLDGLWTEIVSPGSKVMLKIDVQGYEHDVLDGAREHLSDVALIEVEMSLDRLYENGSSIYDLLPRLESAGFRIVSIADGFVDVATGQVLDVDLLAGR